MTHFSSSLKLFKKGGAVSPVNFKYALWYVISLEINCFLNVFWLKLIWIFVWHRWFFSIRSFYARFIFHQIRSISTNHAFLRNWTCRSRVRPIRTSIRWALASHISIPVFVFIGNSCPIFANSVAVHCIRLRNTKKDEMSGQLPLMLLLLLFVCHVVMQLQREKPRCRIMFPIVAVSNGNLGGVLRADALCARVANSSTIAKLKNEYLAGNITFYALLGYVYHVIIDVILLL